MWDVKRLRASSGVTQGFFGKNKFHTLFNLPKKSNNLELTGPGLVFTQKVLPLFDVSMFDSHRVTKYERNISFLQKNIYNLHVLLKERYNLKI